MEKYLVFDMEIDHIALVVPSLEEGIAHWERVFGYCQQTSIVENTSQKVFVVFLQKKKSLPVKLVAPVDETSPVFQYSRRGGGLHHICFKCESVVGEIARLEQLGLRVLSPPQPGEAFEGEDIAFVFAKHGLNIELIDTDKRAGKLFESNQEVDHDI